MMKRIMTVALTVALGLALVAPACAAVQSIRVGGDIVTRGIYRDNLDFLEDGQQSDAWLMTTTRLWVGAELTDNVSAMVRLLNEREWDVELGTGENDITLDLAYVKVGDLFFPGLTMTLGRQEIMLGKGFIVGRNNSMMLSRFAGIAARLSGLLIPGGVPVPTVLNGLWAASDLSARKAFDAIRFDYEAGAVPLNLTVFGAKLGEYNPYASNDADLWGLNVAYDTGNAEIEGYLLNLKNRLTFLGFDHRSDVWTIGARVGHEVYSVPGLMWDAELAYQFGDAMPNVDQKALAGNLDINYTFANPYLPKIGAAYAYYSGDDGTDPTESKNFISMFPDEQGSRVGQLWNALSLNGSFPMLNIVGLLHGGNMASNLHAIKLYGSFTPAERHEVSLAVFPAHRADKVAAGMGKSIGWGVDLGYNFQYTEDLSFGLLGSYVRADDDLADNAGIAPADFDDAAMQVIGTVALSF